MTILEVYNAPFAIALVIMAILALVQVLGLADLFGDGHPHFDIHSGDTPNLADGLVSLFGLGRVPLTIWLALFLGLFAGVGVGTQELAIALTGHPLDRWLAAVIAGVATVPLTGAIVRPLSHILPHDETSAVEIDSLVGRRAHITEGTARAGYPARAQVRDRFGHPHHLMVEPHEPDAALIAGEEILLVRREGNTFYATALAERLLSPN
jgi:hypothetical protein